MGPLNSVMKKMDRLGHSHDTGVKGFNKRWVAPRLMNFANLAIEPLEFAYNAIKLPFSAASVLVKPLVWGARAVIHLTRIDTPSTLDQGKIYANKEQFDQAISENPKAPRLADQSSLFKKISRKADLLLNKIDRNLSTPADVIYSARKVGRYVLGTLSTVIVGFFAPSANIKLHHKMGLTCNPRMAKQDRNNSILKADQYRLKNDKKVDQTFVPKKDLVYVAKRDPLTREIICGELSLRKQNKDTVESTKQQTEATGQPAEGAEQPAKELTKRDVLARGKAWALEGAVEGKINFKANKAAVKAKTSTPQLDSIKLIEERRDEIFENYKRNFKFAFKEDNEEDFVFMRLVPQNNWIKGIDKNHPENWVPLMYTGNKDSSLPWITQEASQKYKKNVEKTKEAIQYFEDKEIVKEAPAKALEHGALQKEEGPIAYVTHQLDRVLKSRNGGVRLYKDITSKVTLTKKNPETQALETKEYTIDGYSTRQVYEPKSRAHKNSPWHEKMQAQALLEREELGSLFRLLKKNPNHYESIVEQIKEIYVLDLTDEKIEEILSAIPEDSKPNTETSDQATTSDMTTTTTTTTTDSSPADTVEDHSKGEQNSSESPTAPEANGEEDVIIADNGQAADADADADVVDGTEESADADETAVTDEADVEGGESKPEESKVKEEKKPQESTQGYSWYNPVGWFRGKQQEKVENDDSDVEYTDGSDADSDNEVNSDDEVN